MSSYGSSAYGSSSFGGGGGSDAHVFFLQSDSLVTGAQRRTAAYGGSAEFYSVHVHMREFFTDPARTVKIYTHNDPAETPILQSIMGEAFESDSAVGAAAFIVVEIVSIDDLPTGNMLITGREVT